ncbi:MAG TPA: solute carrier family 23 protein, partial [Amaricoccus sp.]|nr:solute carrier family 23 protein [Amaricoccus sp.]
MNSAATSSTEIEVKSRRPEDEKLGAVANLAYGLQHILTMYGGIVAVPLIIGQAAGLDPGEVGLLITASLFAGGVATILQTVGLPFFGCQLPLVQGVSFSGVATMIAISGQGGIPAILGAVMAASFLGLLIAPYFSRVIRFFPPLVAGIVITAIGLTLMPVAGFWAMGGNPTLPTHGSVANILLAGVTLVIVLLLSRFGSAAVSRRSASMVTMRAFWTRRRGMEPSGLGRWGETDCRTMDRGMTDLQACSLHVRPYPRSSRRPDPPVRPGAFPGTGRAQWPPAGV